MMNAWFNCACSKRRPRDGGRILLLKKMRCGIIFNEIFKRRQARMRFLSASAAASSCLLNGDVQPDNALVAAAHGSHLQ
jgi:hypothetical protein